MGEAALGGAVRLKITLSDVRNALREAPGKEREAFARELILLISNGTFNALRMSGKFGKDVPMPIDRSDPTR